MLIGHGYDIHKLVKGRKLYLGGIKIPCKVGLSGHSDADVLLHAICDSLLGAAGCGDIGEHFPDTDRRFKDIDSKLLLAKVRDIIKDKGCSIANIDCIVFCEVIKITPIKLKIKQKISKILSISPELVNIKAKTNEGLDAVGQKKAIAASAITLLKKQKVKNARRNT